MRGERRPRGCHGIESADGEGLPRGIRFGGVKFYEVIHRPFVFGPIVRIPFVAEGIRHTLDHAANLRFGERGIHGVENDGYPNQLVRQYRDCESVARPVADLYCERVAARRRSLELRTVDGLVIDK